eukprot:m.38126 g.38126  ORF g.38126 m.38126 type:complete len:665 (+) comp5869_c1_seq1:191-2185(+)
MAHDSVKLQEFVAHSAKVNCCTIGHTGRIIGTGGDDKKVNIWAIGAPRPLMSLAGHSSPVQAIRFDAGQQTVAAGSASGSLKLWDLSNSKIVRTLTGHKAGVSSIDFHPYGDFLASGSQDTNLKVWDIRRNGCIQTYKGHTEPVSCIRFSPDGRWIVSGGEIIKLWDLTAGKLIHEFKLHTGPVTTLEFHPNEFLLATGSVDRTVKFWDLESFKLVSTTACESSKIRAIAFHPEGNALYSGGQDMLHAYQWEPPTCLDAMSVRWGRVASMHSSDGKQLIGAGVNQESVAIWSVDLTTVNHSIKHPADADENCPPSSAGIPAGATTVITRAKSNRPASSSASKPSSSRQSRVASSSSSSSSTAVAAPAGHAAVSDDTYDVMSKDDAFARKPRLPTGAIRAAKIPESAADARPPAPSKDDKDSGFAVAPTMVLPESRVKARTPPAATVSLGPASSVPAQQPPRSSDSRHSNPFDIDVSEFLPAEAPVTVAAPAGVSAQDVFDSVAAGHPSMLTVLSSRLRNVQIVRNCWQNTSEKRALEQLVEARDLGACVDVLSILLQRPNSWTLDMAAAIMPLLKDIVCSQHENYVLVGCKTATLICRSFLNLIINTVRNKPQTFVDISREERYEKCKVCYDQLATLKLSIQSRSEAGRTGHELKKLKDALSCF